MSSRIESGKSPHGSENLELTYMEQAIVDIESHINCKELKSSAFQAYGDAVDEQYTEFVMAETRDTHVYNDLSNIRETIRISKNRIPGYKKSYTIARTLLSELSAAIIRDGVLDKRAYKLSKLNNLGFYNADLVSGTPVHLHIATTLKNKIINRCD